MARSTPGEYSRSTMPPLRAGTRTLTFRTFTGAFTTGGTFPLEDLCTDSEISHSPERHNSTVSYCND